MCRKKTAHFIPKARSTSNTNFPLGDRSWRGSRIAPITICSSISRPAASLSIISMRKPRSASSLTWSNQARESIGRRNGRQDEIGAPFGGTNHFETLGEKGDELRDTVALPDRDSMKQERV